GWISQGYYGLDQGPIVIMMENHRSGFLWELMKTCPAIIEGLRKAGFTGGWL
ncbi:MAG: glucoamylase family protein, partial [Gemmatimonadaceae bacterium]